MDFFEDTRRIGEVNRILLYSDVPNDIIEYLEDLESEKSWVYSICLDKNGLGLFENQTILSDEFFSFENRDINFDELKFSRLVNKKQDIDVIVSSNIGHISQIANIFYNKTRHRPSLIGLIPDEQEISLLEISSIVETDLTLCSEEKKDIVLKKAKKWFLDDFRSTLNQRIETHKNLQDSIEQLVSDQRRISDRSEAIYRIMDKIKEEGSIKKYDLLNWLGWGRQIAWTPYRRRLLDNPHYFDMLTPDPYYTYKRKED